MPDIFDVTDEMRRKIPEIVKNGEDFLDYTKKNFLLIEKNVLLNTAIEHVESVIGMLQTAVIALYLYFQNTNSEEAYKQISLHIKKCEVLENLVKQLKEKGQSLEKVQIVKLIEDQIKDEPKLLNNLLMYVELCFISDEGESDDE